MRHWRRQGQSRHFFAIDSQFSEDGTHLRLCSLRHWIHLRRIEQSHTSVRCRQVPRSGTSQGNHLQSELGGEAHTRLLDSGCELTPHTCSAHLTRAHGDSARCADSTHREGEDSPNVMVPSPRRDTRTSVAPRAACCMHCVTEQRRVRWHDVPPCRKASLWHLKDCMHARRAEQLHVVTIVY